jgi:hypothetical protein
MSNLGSFITSTTWPFVAIHLAMLPNGDFVSWGNEYNANGIMDKIGIHRYNIQSKTFTHIQYSALVNTQNNPFCGGHILDMHGNLIVAGGLTPPSPS